jgi:ELP3 family radical SAM enzyme/protein acetyltransferase
MVDILSKIKDIEDYCKAKPEAHVFKTFKISSDDFLKFKNIIIDLNSYSKINDKIMKQLWIKYKTVPPKPRLMEVYFQMVENENFTRSIMIEDFLSSHEIRGISGVSVCAIFLSPYPNGQKFTCRWNCHYCPNEPGQPRSYLFGEPGVLRANQNKFDCVEQLYSRINSLKACGHPTDKFEVKVLGGTIHSYPKDYLEEFMRDIYYAANTCSSKHSRKRNTLEEEQDENEISQHRIIGLTIETRPDCINSSELINFRKWGVTRIEIGVQHTEDSILKAVNRGHGIKQSLKAIKLMRDCGFKEVIHLMPNLPTSTEELDIKMIDYIIKNVCPDEVKMYPTTTTPFTQILEDYKEGKYIPYGNESLENVILHWLMNVNEWTRNDRIVRDIPKYYIVDGVKSSNQKQEFDEIMKEKGIKCKCIRYREAGRHENYKSEDGELVIRTYDAHGGKEYFISWESKDKEVIFGFVRLRLVNKSAFDIFPELENCALIRELHVYGKTIKVNDKNDGISSQHIGIGKILMNKAEEIAKENGFNKISVIAGIGTRNYYKKIGYEKIETFMIKKI